ncbi:hypothetical protein [Clostridium oceanicum]|uniref:Apea-like HEPN domain-containing protein n=1 Tax=Clostridium oceanicum TaxID=1543 RepID=A0ABN1JJQ3_9CLOT
MDNKQRYTVTICAVIFNVDKTLLNVNLDNGFEFRLMSLIPSKNQLDEIFETDVMALRQDYETAKINENLNVICVFKSDTISLNETEAEEYTAKMSDEVLKYLDDKIRAIRLFVESPICFTNLSIKMKGETEFKNIIPINEAMVTNPISGFHCNDEEIDKLNKNISSMKFPLSDDLLNNCHRYYDLSYHQENFISITLLITCLEILFLGREKAKKEKLAKRCSVFLYESKKERLICYKNLLDQYKKRSEFVHDGDCSKIINQDILFLRDCVRKSIIKYLRSKFGKKEIIKNLKDSIQKLDYWTS